MQNGPRKQRRGPGQAARARPASPATPGCAGPSFSRSSALRRGSIEWSTHSEDRKAGAAGVALGTTTLRPRAVCVHGAHHTPRTVFTLGGVEQVVAEPSRIVEVAQAQCIGCTGQPCHGTDGHARPGRAK